MQMVYCESHQKMELMVETASGPVQIVTLNEQAEGPHHVSRVNPRLYCHAGPQENCQLCQEA